MLTEEQLEILSNALAPLFSYLEHEVIVDIARRVKKTMTYSRTAELQALSMRELGFSPVKIRKEVMKLLNADPDFRKAVAKNTLEYKREVRKIINETEKKAYLSGNKIVAGAGDMAWVNDLSVWKDAGKELKDGSFLPQLVKSFSGQTAGALNNITQTTGFKSVSGFEGIEGAYRKELDKAVIKICSGAFDREKVLKDVVHDLSQSGLRSIDYESGYSMQLDTAARMALRTGCHQLAGKVSDENIKQSGENLAYVSKHWGARNTGIGHANHEQWQGKVYFIREGTDYSEEARRIGQDRITSLWHATGYSADGAHENDPLGLYGYNCRHNHHPWFEGVSKLPKESPEPEPVTINGKTCDYYAVTQKMRSMERTIRALKREKEALKSLGMDVTEVNAKLSRKRGEYKAFCKQAGVREQRARLRYECGTSDLKRTQAWKEYENIHIKEYRIVNSDGIVGGLKDSAALNDYLSVLPRKAKDALSDVKFHMNSERGSGYMYSEKTVYLSANATRQEVLHEVGHHLEFTLFDKKKVDDLKRNLVQGLSKDDIIIKTAINSAGQKGKVFLLDSDRFIDEYQSRLYVSHIEEALNEDGSINVDVMAEVISVATERYFRVPKALKKNFPEIYQFIEEALL